MFAALPMRSGASTIWLGLSLLIGSADRASAEPLTFGEALVRATSAAPSIRAAQLQSDASRATARAAGELPDPKLSVGITDFPISGPLLGRPDLDNFSMATLGYSQDVPNRAKRRARIALARSAITEGEARLLVERRSVRVATALAWIDLHFAIAKLKALERLTAELKIDNGTATARVTSGASRAAAALEPRQAVAALEDRREALRSALLKARADLVRWIGPITSVELVGPVPMPEVDATDLRVGIDALPQLAVRAALLERAQAEKGLAKADALSDWGYEVEYSRRDPRFGDYVSAKLNFSLPLFTSKRQAPMIAARTAEVGRAVADMEAARREIEAALEGELAEHAMHHALLARAREVLIPLARERAELETAAYRARTASLTEVLAARRAVIDAELDGLDREAEAVRDGVRLNLTYGEEGQ